MQPDCRHEFKEGAAYIDGRFVPVPQATIPIMDWGFLHSDATYDVVHVWQGSFFRLDDHLDRFQKGMRRLHMSLDLDRAGMREILLKCVRLSGLTDAYVEMICTRGIPVPGSRDPRRCVNRFYAFAIPFVWIADPEQQRRGLHLVISRVQRIPGTAVDPSVKNYHWLDLVAGLYEAYERGGETAILVDGRGNVVEGPGFNIFAPSRRRLITPAEGILEGITRKTVMEIGRMLDRPVEARTVSGEEVRNAEEVFVSSTAGGIMPVTRIDDRLIGDGNPGPVTLAIQKRYWDLHRDPRHATPVD